MDLDDLEPGSGPAKPKDLSTWNIEDLEQYIERLELEIGRARSAIAEKRRIGDAARALFRS